MDYIYDTSTEYFIRLVFSLVFSLLMRIVTSMKRSFRKECPTFTITTTVSEETSIQFRLKKKPYNKVVWDITVSQKTVIRMKVNGKHWK